ncbi:MAG: hypothetical protein AAF456_10150 [Planctomycetota bacterium]
MALTISLSPAAQAQTTWTNPVGGAFGNNSNWSAGAPDFMTEAVFDLNSNYSVSLNFFGNASEMSVTDGNVHFNGGGSLDGGTLITMDDCDVALSGPGTTLLTNYMSIANSGNANFTIESGSHLDTNFLNVASALSGLQAGVNISGAGTTAEVSTITLGGFSTANLTVDQQASLDISSTIYAGHNNGGNATILFRDPGTVVTATIMSLGLANGTATLNVENGAATSSGSMYLGSQNGSNPDPGTGIANYTGFETTGVTDSISLADHENSYGELNISDTARFEVTEYMELAAVPGSTALVTVDGQGSVLAVSTETTSELLMGTENYSSGPGGVAQLVLSGGANVFVGDDQLPLAGNVMMVSSFVSPFGAEAVVKNGSEIVGLDYLHIGFSPGSEGEVLFADSGTSCIINDSLNVGVLGEGELTIENGAYVETSSFYVGSQGRYGVTIDGAGSQLIADNITLEELTFTATTICNGGAISAQNQFEIGDLSQLILDGAFADAGQLSVDGELLVRNADVTAPVVVSNTGLINAESGINTISGDVSLNNGTIVVEDGAELEVVGNFDGNGDLSGTGLLRLRGALNLGTTPQVFQFDGTLLAGFGSNIVFKIGGTSPSQYDRLNVGRFDTGVFDFGSFQIQFANGFIPSQGQQFLLVTTDDLVNSTWDGYAEGDLVGTVAGEDIFITFEAGDGNDIAIYTSGTRTVTPQVVDATKGTFVEGVAEDLAASDNSDFSISRNNFDIQSRTEFIAQSISPFTNPNELTIRLEGSVFARSAVQQTVYMYNYVADDWEEVDSRRANRLIDRVDDIVLTGDLSRFVAPATRRIRTRVLYKSDSPRQQFNSNTDMLKWRIGL